MHWMSRDWLCRRLRISLCQSKSLIPSGYRNCVSSDAVLALVNSARRNISKPFPFVPSDIMTADELASSPELAESGISAHALHVFTRRGNPRNQPPWLHLNSHATRFVKSLFLAWLAERAESANRTGRKRFV